MSERRVSPLSGAYNFRDLGGLPTRDGRRTRSGVLFRSDTLQALTDDDVDLLVERLGVQVVVDLRTEQEAVEQGRGPLGAHPVGYLNLPLPDAKPVPRADGEHTIGFYLDHLDAPSPALAVAVQVLASVAGRPTVVHCAAGKDRTGLVVALVLLLVGVDPDAVVADYTDTAPNMDRITERFRRWPRYAAHMDAVAPELYRAEEATIRRFLAELDRRYGGARGWARARGVDDAAVSRLTTALVEDAPP